MYNKLLLSLTFATLASPLFAQQTAPEICGTMANLERLKKEHPELEKQMADYEARLQQWSENVKENPAVQMPTITIPTVVHIVWATPSENVSNAEIGRAHV